MFVWLSDAFGYLQTQGSLLRGCSVCIAYIISSPENPSVPGSAFFHLHQARVLVVLC